jgi:hypothetical protein
MIIKILWLICSLFVFRYTLKNLIKEELKIFGGIDAILLGIFIIMSIIIAAAGPIAIVAFLVYNGLKGIANGISEGYQNERSRV